MHCSYFWIAQKLEETDLISNPINYGYIIDCRSSKSVMEILPLLC